MDKTYIQHGEGADIKAARPNNKQAEGNPNLKTKIDMPANKKEGVKDEPTHSSDRGRH